MDLNTLYIYVELMIGIISIAYPLYHILEMHTKLSTKVDMMLGYLSTHEQRLLEMEKMINELSKAK